MLNVTQKPESLRNYTRRNGAQLSIEAVIKSHIVHAYHASSEQTAKRLFPCK